jgi:hypothetical protein
MLLGSAVAAPQRTWQRAIPLCKTRENIRKSPLLSFG